MSKKTIQKEPVGFGDFLAVNHDKLHRVIEGTVGRGGETTGGLGKDADPQLILATYDKLGGLILRKDGTKIASGAFWDFENRCPRKEPIVETAKANTSGQRISTVTVGDAPKGKKGRKQVIDEADEDNG